MASLKSLPVELVEEILNWLSPHDLAMFARASTFARNITVPLMYRNNRMYDNSSAIGKAVSLESLEGIRRALEQGLDVNGQSEAVLRRTALHCAVRYCRPGRSPLDGSRAEEIFNLLLGAGADPTLKDIDYLTPFDYACRDENYAAALILLDKQAAGEIDLRLNQRAVYRALHQVVQPLGRHNPWQHPHLGGPERRAKISRFRRDYRFNIDSYHAKQRELVRRLLDMPGMRQRINGDAPTSGDRFRYMPLLHASLFPCSGRMHGRIMPDLEIARLLLAAGAKPNAMAALPHASGYRIFTAIQAVMLLGAKRWDADRGKMLRSFDGSSSRIPAHRAPTEKDLVDFIRLLVSYGARLDVTCWNPANLTPIIDAVGHLINCTSSLEYYDGSPRYLRMLAIVRTVLALKGPQNKTAENPRPATWGILPKRQLSHLADHLLDIAERDPWRYPVVFGLLRDHGAEVKELALLDGKRDGENGEDGEDGSEDESLDSGSDSDYEERPRKRARTGTGNDHAGQTTAQDATSVQVGGKRTRSGRRY